MPSLHKNSPTPRQAAATAGRLALPGQVVLVLQGGGALGAYQVGVYEALHEAGIEPDWVIGTSIGAINAALIAGNAPAESDAALREFWARVEQRIRSPASSACYRARQRAGEPRDRAAGIPALLHAQSASPG